MFLLAQKKKAPNGTFFLHLRKREKYINDWQIKRMICGIRDRFIVSVYKDVP